MVSIVMAYLNRRREIINTLDSIKPYQVDNMEVIIVDDGSVDEHSIDDLVEKYDFTIKLIKINRADKPLYSI
jgi:glycosyltransferase involved in cell wall biosynthesis